MCVVTERGLYLGLGDGGGGDLARHQRAVVQRGAQQQHAQPVEVERDLRARRHLTHTTTSLLRRVHIAPVLMSLCIRGPYMRFDARRCGLDSGPEFNAVNATRTLCHYSLP